ncbi:MAG: dCTP deaminase [Vampirovibrionales bacterium]
MAILNETHILERLVHPTPEKRIVITPLIKPEEQIGPTSVDLRLGTDFQVMRRAQTASIDPLQHPEAVAPQMKELWQWVTVPVGQPFILHPGEFALAHTLEHVTLPLDLSARLEGRSTWGRLGLQIHATAGFVDPGFSGSLTFELSNVSMVPLPLYPGVRISQLCFYENDSTNLPYTRKQFSKYSGKPTAHTSAFFLDPEYARMREALQPLHP